MPREPPVTTTHPLDATFLPSDFVAPAAGHENQTRIKTEGADSALTDWSRSSFFSSNGREVDSVVFQEKLRLPTPLGQFVHTLPTFERLSIADRLSLWRLAFALVDYQSDYERYEILSIPVGLL